MLLFALEQALREVWAVLKAHDPHGYLDKDQDLQKAIADKLTALADSGVTDPWEMGRIKRRERSQLEQGIWRTTG
jgi:hypothetical protein